jgi:hypothetical protein
MSDFAERVARRRLAEIEAGRAHATAAWKSAEVDNNEYEAIEAYKLIQEFNKDEVQTRQDYQQHVASQNPPAPPQPSPEAWRNKRHEEMTHEDVHQMLNQTSEVAKLGGGLSYDEHIKQINNLNQAKARGDYSGKA